MADDAKLFERGVCKLAARIPFEGMGQHDSVKTFQH
jgi:hypothetical protein